MSDHVIYQLVVLLCATQGVKSGIEHLPKMRPIKGGAAWLTYLGIAAVWWVIGRAVKVEHFSTLMDCLLFFAVPGAYSFIAMLCRAISGARRSER